MFLAAHASQRFMGKIRLVPVLNRAQLLNGTLVPRVFSAFNMAACRSGLLSTQGLGTRLERTPGLMVISRKSALSPVYLDHLLLVEDKMASNVVGLFYKLGLIPE